MWESWRKERVFLSRPNLLKMPSKASASQGDTNPVECHIDHGENEATQLLINHSKSIYTRLTNWIKNKRGYQKYKTLINKKLLQKASLLSVSVYYCSPEGSAASGRWSVPSDSPLSRRPLRWIMTLCLTARLAEDSWGDTV